MIYVVAMRMLAVILIAWPGSYALSRFVATGDFYWFSLILGCPLFALSLWRYSAQAVPLIEARRAAVLDRPFPFALARRRITKLLEMATRITNGFGQRLQRIQHARAA